MRDLLNKAVDRAAEEASVSRDFVQGLPPGPQKREIVDDITIVVLDLDKQY